MANGVSILPGFAPGLTTEQLDTVRGETYRRVCDENQYLRRERNALADRVLALTHRAALAEEERDILKRRIDRLMAEREVLMEAADVDAIRAAGGV